MKSILVRLVLGASLASAISSYQALTTIPWAQSNPISVGQSTFFNGIYYLADRTNQGVQVIDLANKSQIFFIGGFIGIGTVNGNTNIRESGPNGLVVLASRNELYVGDARGNIKVINLATNNVVADITVDSTDRVDKIAYDHDTGTIVCTIPDEVPPRVAVISSQDRSVTGYITFTDATAGLGQPAWNSVDGQFYISVPSTGANMGGEVAVIDVNNLKIAKVFPLPQCIPAGIVFGPNQNLFVACSQEQIFTYDTANSLVVDVTTGDVIANIPGIAGVDQVAYDSKLGYYFASAYQNLAVGSSTSTPLPQLAIIEAITNTLFQVILTDNLTANTVAIDPNTDKVVVPISAQGLIIYINSSANLTSGPPTASPPSSRSGGGIGLSASIGIGSGTLVGIIIFLWLFKKLTLTCPLLC